MNGGLGFATVPLRGKHELVCRMRHGELVRVQGEGIPVYRMKILELAEPETRGISRILALYENSNRITSYGPRRVGCINKLVEMYAGAAAKGGRPIGDREKEKYSKACFYLSGDGLGPISVLLEEDELEEIMINGLGPDKPVCVYHRRFGMCKTNVHLTHSTYFTEKANQMLSNIGRRIDETHPRANGTLKNGDRVSVIIPPYGLDYIMDVRKFPQEPMTVLDFISNGTISPQAAAFLWLVFEVGGNIGIVGNTGAGKTALLNSFLRFVRGDRRILCVEETPEIKILHEQSLKLISVENYGLSLKDAILDTMRLRPDRVVIGEVRSDEEVCALRDSLLSGQAMGTYFTYHSENSAFALQRLRRQGFNDSDLLALDVLVVCRRFEKKCKGLCRAVTEIAEVVDVGGKAEPRLLFKFDFRKMRLVASAERSGVCRKISQQYLDSTASGVRNELKIRKSLLEALLRDKSGDAELFHKLHEFRRSS